MNNTYQAPSQLFVENDPNLSQEETTQGNPLAVSMYGIALPLISCAQTSSIVENSKLTGNCLETNGTPRFFYCRCLRGKPYVYLVNGLKCQLVVKESKLEDARIIFANTDVKITKGTCPLGSVIGDSSKCSDFDLVSSLCTSMLEKFSQFSQTFPQNVFFW